MEVAPEEIIGKYWQRIDTKFPELRQELEKLEFNLTFKSKCVSLLLERS
jgi:hypothetical protein